MFVSENTCLIFSVSAFMSQVSDTRSTTTGSSARIGYTRVSTVSRTLDQQNAALEAAGVMKTFSDTMSGARQRPAQGRARGRHADPQGNPRGQAPRREEPLQPAREFA
jgi:hypothetical protein